MNMTSSPIENILAFSFSDIKKLQEFYAFPVTALRDAEREIDDQREYIHHLEAVIAKTEDERDHYKMILQGCL